jgi:ribosomal protein L27
MKPLPLKGLLLAAALALAACSHPDTQNAANTSSGSPSSGAPVRTADAKKLVADGATGHQVAADGSIAADQQGKTFTAGQPVFVALHVAKAPAGTLVHVDWIGPDNQAVASDEQPVRDGQAWMDFTSPDTSTWKQGDYHADVSTGGAKADSESFSLVPPEKAEVTATAPKSTVKEVAVGHQVAADGTIAADQKGKKFTPGQPVIVAFKVGQAPPGTAVNADWFGPHDNKVNSDTKQVDPGQTSMHFSSGDTSTWVKGDYRVELWVDGQKVATESFSIVNPERADRGTS